LAVSPVSYAQQPTAGIPAEPLQQPDKEQVQLIYTPWTKYCVKMPDGKEPCFIGNDGRTEFGEVQIAAVVVEVQSAPRKILRVTVPLRVQIAPGSRLIIDNNIWGEAPYLICYANGCVSDYEAPQEMIAKLKDGQNLYVQTINENGLTTTLSLPLQETPGEFAKAYNGAPADLKTLEDHNRTLQEELHKRANKAQQRLKGSQPPTGATTPNLTEK
jgi:invasion protein IalB